MQEKQAALPLRSLWSGAKALAGNGVWKSVGESTAKRMAAGNGGAMTRGLNSAARVMTGTPGKAMGAYGIAGMLSPLAGIDLPGSQLAMNATMPVWGLASMAAPAITGARMADKQNQDALKNDTLEGARRAGQDFITMLHGRPDALASGKAYRDALGQAGVNLSGTDSYLNNEYGHREQPGWFRRLAGFITDPQEAINYATREKIQAEFNKQAAFIPGAAKALGKSFSRVGGGIGRAFTPLAMLATGAGVVGAATADKPYDADAAMQEGYAAANAAISKKLDNQTMLQRIAMRADPTLAVGKLQQLDPNLVTQWENSTGMKYRPGWLSSIKDAWTTGGRPSYFTYDAAGDRHYI